MPKGMPGRALCSTDGCGAKNHAKGLCTNCYARAAGKRSREKKQVARQRPCIICGTLFDGIREP